MTYSYKATFHNSKKCTFGGEADIEPIKDDGTEKSTDEIMVEVKKALLAKYSQFFAVWADITAFEVEDSNKNIIFEWRKK